MKKIIYIVIFGTFIGIESMERPAKSHSGNHSQELEFVNAAGRGDIKKLKDLIHAGVDVNAQNNEGTALLSALMWIDQRTVLWEVLGLLLEAGAKVNAPNNYGITPLMRAIQRQSLYGIDIVNFLLDKGADINAQTPTGETALTVASGNGYKDVVKLLINRGANVNIKGGRSNVTPIKVARERGHEDIVTLLKNYGATE